VDTLNGLERGNKMYSLQLKDNGLFLDNDGNLATRLTAINIRDKETAAVYLENYYLINGDNAAPVQVVPYPKEDNLTLQSEWTTFKYELAKHDKYADKINASLIIH